MVYFPETAIIGVPLSVNNSTIFKQLIHTIPHPILVFQASGRTVFTNRAFADCFGYGIDQVPTRTDWLMRAFPDPDERAAAQSYWESKIPDSDPGRQWSITCADNTRHTLLIRPVVHDSEIALVFEHMADRHPSATGSDKIEELAEMLPQGVFEIDTDGKISFANTCALEALGYDRGSYEKGLDARELVVPEDREKVTRNILRVLSGKNTSTNEYTALRKDGSTFPVLIHSAPIYHNHTLIGLRGMMVDITDRKKAEQALAESEEMYRTVFETTGTAMIIFGEDTIITRANTEAEKFSGYTLEEIEGKKSWIEFVHKDDLVKMQQLHQQRTDTSVAIPENYEFRFVDRWGKIRDIYLSIAVIPGTKNRVSSLVDITERKKFEAALQESEERYRRLFEDSKDMIIMTTPEGKYLDANPSAVNALGYDSKEELLQVAVADTYYNRQDRKKFQQIIARDGFIKNYELELRKKDDTPFTTVVSSTPLRDQDGNIIAYQSIIRDVTERRRLEQQLFQAQKMESIGTLAGGIAHDFNNILAGILGYASFMKTKIDQSHQFYNYINTIEKSSQRAAELTAQILAFARGGKYDIKPININTIVNDTVKIIGRTVDKSIEVATRLDQSLPTVDADASQLQQALMNLFVNARDAMPGGGRLVIETRLANTSEVRAEPGASSHQFQYITLSVSDTGHGMDKSVQQRIFDPFFTTKEKGKGTGLGLSMVYGIIDNHDGFMRVQSKPRKGTIFSIYLPVSGKPEETAQKTQADDNLHGTECVLIVDDEEDVRIFNEEIFKEYGYRVLLAENGEEAVAVYKEQQENIDLVVLDMVMPKMGGYETFLTMKELNPDVKALLATGYSQDGKAQEILDQGVQGFIQKPCQVAKLLSLARSILDGTNR